MPLTRAISFNDFQGTLGQLPAGTVARVRLSLSSASPVAAALMMKASEEVGTPERVDGTVSALALDASGDGATLTLEPGLLVHLTATATIEQDGADVTFQELVDHLQGDLAASPPVRDRIEARRDSVIPTLGPSDAFPARALELVTDGAGADVRVNVTSANLIAIGTGDCTSSLSATLIGCIRVLGFTAGIDSTTQLDEMRAGAVETEFAGVLDCRTLVTADSVNGTFDLVDEGLHIVVDSATFAGRHDGDREDGGDGHGDGGLVGLAAAGAACAAGDTVHVRGEGVVDSASSSTVHATEVRFSIAREEDGGDGHDGGDNLGEVEGAIDSVVAPDVFVAGREVVTDSATAIRRGDSTITLADLAAGDTVKVDGTVQSDGSILAREIDVTSEEHDDDASRVEFDGVIDSIAAPVLIVSGRVVVTDDSTEFNDDGAITFADLRVADRVEIRGVARSDGSVLAQRVDVKH